MDTIRIREKESRINKGKKYSYYIMDKEPKFSGETVEQFLARGGKIQNIKSPKMPDRDSNGKFLKRCEESNG